MTTHRKSHLSRREWLRRAGLAACAVGMDATAPFQRSRASSAEDRFPDVRVADGGAPSDSPSKSDAATREGAAVSFGFSLYGMRALSVDEGLKECAAIGYDSVELVASDGWPCDPKTLSAESRAAIRERMSDSNLALASLMENLGVLADEAGHRKNLDRLAAAANLGRELSPRDAPVIETILGGKPDQWEATRDRFATALADWAKVAEKERVVVTIKPHVAGALHTPAGALWLMERVGSPWLRLAYDFSHYRLRGLDLPATVRSLLPHSSFIHIKDARGTAEAFQFLLPGEGDIDYSAYFQLLEKARWRGAIVVEVSGQIHSKPGYDPRKAARQSYEAIAPAFQKAGLKRVKTKATE